MDMVDEYGEDIPAGAGAPLSAPDGQVFLQEVPGERPRALRTPSEGGRSMHQMLGLSCSGKQLPVKQRL